VKLFLIYLSAHPIHYSVHLLQRAVEHVSYRVAWHTDWEWALALAYKADIIENPWLRAKIPAPGTLHRRWVDYLAAKTGYRGAVR
jgi:hypothetical protein